MSFNLSIPTSSIVEQVTLMLLIIKDSENVPMLPILISSASVQQAVIYILHGLSWSYI